MEALLPVAALEEQLAERIVMCFWSLRRVYRIEASLFARDDEADVLSYSGARDVGAVFRTLARNGSLAQLSRYETMRERCLCRALAELERLQAARAKREALGAPAARGIRATVADRGRDRMTSPGGFED
jgi:hypothetical protein